MLVCLAELVCSGWGIRTHPDRMFERESEKGGGECKSGDVWLVERHKAMAGLGRLLGRQAGMEELATGDMAKQQVVGGSG